MGLVRSLRGVGVAVIFELCSGHGRCLLAG